MYDDKYNEDDDGNWIHSTNSDGFDDLLTGGRDPEPAPAIEEPRTADPIRDPDTPDPVRDAHADPGYAVLDTFGNSTDPANDPLPPVSETADEQFEPPATDAAEGVKPPAMDLIGDPLDDPLDDDGGVL